MAEFIAQTLNGLTLAGVIFLVASGFTLVFGIMRVTTSRTARCTCSAATSATP